MEDYKLDSLHTFIKILVVDDIYLKQKSVSKLLKECGYFVLSASSGREAIEKLQKYSPHIITVSHSLNDITLLNLVKTINKYSENGKILYLKSIDSNTKSSLEDTEYINSILNLPVDRDEIEETVSNLLKEN